MLLLPTPLCLEPLVSFRRNLGAVTTDYNPGIFSSMSMMVLNGFLSPSSWIPPGVYSPHPHQEHWDQDRSSSGCWWAVGCDCGSVLVLDAPWWNKRHLQASASVQVQTYVVHSACALFLPSDDAPCPRDLIIPLRPLAGDMQALSGLDLFRSVQVWDERVPLFPSKALGSCKRMGLFWNYSHAWAFLYGKGNL